MTKVNFLPEKHENVLKTNQRVQVVQSSSTQKGSRAENVLNDDESKMWTSGPGMPQSLCIDLGNNFKNSDGHTL